MRDARGRGRDGLVLSATMASRLSPVAEVTALPAGPSTRGVVVHVSPVGSVAVSGDRATIGAGARLGPVYEALDGDGLAIPGGTCPSVGIAGLTLGGGLGILGRSYGVTSDRLVSAQVVLADARIVDCDDERHDDLFWAIRGAGAANFGVVTSLTFRTVPATAATNLHLAWPHTKAGARYRCVAAVGAHRSRPAGRQPEAHDLCRPRRPSVGRRVPGLVRRRRRRGRPGRPAGRRCRLGLGLDDRGEACPSRIPGGSGHDWASNATKRLRTHLSLYRAHLFAKSEFFRRPLPAEAIESLVGGGCPAASQVRPVSWTSSPWGGAYNRRPRQATAFPHRDELFQLKHAAVVAPAASAPETRAAQRWVNESWESVHPWASGPGLPELRRPGPRRMGDRLLRPQLRPPDPDQTALRPRRALPLPSVRPGGEPVARHIGAGRDPTGAAVHGGQWGRARRRSWSCGRVIVRLQPTGTVEVVDIGPSRSGCDEAAGSKGFSSCLGDLDRRAAGWRGLQTSHPCGVEDVRRSPPWRAHPAPCSDPRHEEWADPELEDNRIQRDDPDAGGACMAPFLALVFGITAAPTVLGVGLVFHRMAVLERGRIMWELWRVEAADGLRPESRHGARRVPDCVGPFGVITHRCHGLTAP